jgi:hypothetical protein
MKRQRPLVASPRLNTGEPSELEYWARSFDVSKERLLEAVEQVGESLNAIRTELAKARRPNSAKR